MKFLKHPTSFALLSLLLFFSCGKDSNEPIMPNGENKNNDEASLTSGLVIVGDVKDSINGNFLLEPWQYEITSDSSLTNIVNLRSEVGIADSDNPKYYASNDGVIFFNRELNVDTGSDGLFPYYKNFENGVVSGYNEFTTSQSLKSYGDFKGDLYGMYYDYQTLEVGGSYEYFLKIIDSDDFTERKISLGRYKATGYFKLKQSGDYLFIYHSKSLIGNGEATLAVIDLNDVEIVNTLSDLPDERFTLVKGTDGNCYFFSANISYKYEVSSQMLVEQNIGGDTFSLSNVISSDGIEPIVHNDVLYYAVPGPQPGLQFFHPSIYDLATGERNFIQITDELTQFEGDPFEWQPTFTALNYDVEKELFYLGVYSAGYPFEATSYGVFAVDFEGNVLEKTKIPIRPTKIIR